MDIEKKLEKNDTDLFFERIDKKINEQLFFVFLSSCMILMPLAEFVSELFGMRAYTQPVILMLYGYLGIMISVLRFVCNIRYKNIKWQDIFFITLLFFAAISLAFSTNMDHSFGGFEYNESPAHYLAYFSLMYAGFQIENLNLRKKVIVIFLTLAFFEGIIGILQTFEIKIMPVYYETTTTQVYGLTQNTNFFGGLSVLFVGVSAAAFIFFEVKKNRIIYGIVFVIAFYCSFNTMARLAWVGDFSMLCFLIISIIIMKHSEKKKNLYEKYQIKYKSYFVSWLIIVGLSVAILVLSFCISDLPKSRVDSSLNEIQSGNSDDFGSGRGYIWKYCLESVPKHWVTGIGLNNLRECFFENPSWKKGMYFQDKAHNEYIHILATEGVFALINYLALLFISVKLAVKRIINTEDNMERIITWVFLTMFIGYMTQALFNSSIINVAMYFWVVIGVLNPKDKVVIHDNINIGNTQ